MILHIDDDLDLSKTADSGQCFRWQNTADNTWRIPHRGECLTITDLCGGDFELDCTEEQFRSVWYAYFDLENNYAAIRSLIDPGEDPFLFKASQSEKGIRILRQDPWEMLISFIISQNKNIPAIRRSVGLLSEMCGERKMSASGQPFYVFPTPEAIAALTADDLAKCRLGYRCRYVHAAAEAVLTGKIELAPLENEAEEKTLAALTSLFGVGVKVASCVSLFGLHHLNAFPVDVWIRRILENEYPNGYPFEKYSPYNGIFQQYMFAYYREQNN
ncbi:MAG: DNA-3-methyladenine glycosylase 2 family protein [Lachnospiraceae bacterium]|nr:DNA-3-methyladenine glycosylase 2 family protein [Lachnospiraceae bacterium]